MRPDELRAKLKMTLTKSKQTEQTSARRSKTIMGLVTEFVVGKSIERFSNKVRNALLEVPSDNRCNANNQINVAADLLRNLWNQSRHNNVYSKETNYLAVAHAFIRSFNQFSIFRTFGPSNKNSLGPFLRSCPVLWRLTGKH